MQFNLRPPYGQRHWQIKVVGHDSEAALNSPVRMPELHIVPDFSGGGGGSGLIKVVIGVIIIVAAVAISFASYGVLTPIALAFISFGAGLVLGGILELISPSPKLNTPNSGSGNDPASSYLGSPKNTVKIGTRIPRGYGRYQLYGHIISYFVQADPGSADQPAPNSSERAVTNTLGF